MSNSSTQIGVNIKRKKIDVRVQIFYDYNDLLREINEALTLVQISLYLS